MRRVRSLFTPPLGLAHVVEQVVISVHYSAGHGPQLGVLNHLPRQVEAIRSTQPCPVWRRYLAGRVP